MIRILAGIETEYGLLIEGRGAEDQVEDSQALVQSYPDECFVAWDYRYESPRADLRGFKLEHLAFDPIDAEFDRGKPSVPAHEIRADRILPNGARFYNDHGHPEYATPECWSLQELAEHDRAGQQVVLRAAKAYEAKVERRVQVYKNNTDFHGASYGTHESYQVERKLGFAKLFEGVTPMLVARQILTGAGKVGAENGRTASFQISQRADFFAEPANAETLFRRPVFNTRDEPHADPEAWIRMHVISGDANMILTSTWLKVGLVKLALQLTAQGVAPLFRLADPVRAFQSISTDESYQFRVELAGGSWTTAYDIIEGYCAAAEHELDLDEDLRRTIDTARRLSALLREDFPAFAQHVDWAAKRRMLEDYMASEGTSWRDPGLRAFDLEYCNADPDESLHQALVEMGSVEAVPSPEADLRRLTSVDERNRAYARGLAVRNWRSSLRTASWRSLVFEVGGQLGEVELRPEVTYPVELASAPDVSTFIAILRELNHA